MTKQEAIAALGSAKSLADALGITESAVSQWGDNVPILRQYQLKEMLNSRAKGQNSDSDRCA